MKNLIKFCIISSLGLSILLPANLFAVNNPSEPYLFMKDMIQVVSYIHSSVERLKPEKESTNETDEYLTTKMMKDLQTATYDIEHAISFLNKHKESKQEAITKSTEAMLSALKLLSKNFQDSIKYFEKMYSPESIKNPGAGKMMSDMGKLLADRDEVLKMCMLASIMSTYALVSDKHDKEGHLSYLTITSKERDDLKKELVDNFGEGIKEGVKSAQSLAMTPASSISEFLKRDFTPSDKKR